MISNDFFNERAYIAYEYEAWLAPRTARANEGGNLDLLFYRGHNMQPYDLPQNENLLVYAITPEGKRQNIEMSRSTKNSYIYTVKLENQGLYHFIAKKTAYYSVDAEGEYLSGSFENNPNAVSATRYLQYAHMALSAGRSIASADDTPIPPVPLRILPDRWDRFRAGETFAFMLFFEDRPLPLFDVEIVYTKGDREARREKLLSDGSGKVTFPIGAPGKYLILVSYMTPETKEGSYYDTKYIYTFCFKARA